MMFELKFARHNMQLRSSMLTSKGSLKDLGRIEDESFSSDVASTIDFGN